MITSVRLENAIQKLYTAFHNDTLHPEYCERCAVGNIMHNQGAWQHLTDTHGSLHLNYVGLVHQRLGRKFQGYTPLELLQIEAVFLQACGYVLPLKKGSKRPTNPKDKEVLFKGRSAVVSYLCTLDQLPDVMDCSALFNFKKEPATAPTIGV